MHARMRTPSPSSLACLTYVHDGSDISRLSHSQVVLHLVKSVDYVLLLRVYKALDEPKVGCGAALSQHRQKFTYLGGTRTACLKVNQLYIYVNTLYNLCFIIFTLKNPIGLMRNPVLSTRTLLACKPYIIYSTLFRNFSHGSDVFLYVKHGKLICNNIL